MLTPETRDTGRRRLTEEQAEQYDCLECRDERVYRTSRYDCRTRTCAATVHPCPECSPDCQHCGAEHSVLWTRHDGEHCDDCGALVCVDCGEAPAFWLDEHGEPFCFLCAYEDVTHPELQRLQSVAVSELRNVGLYPLATELAIARDVEELRKAQHQAATALNHATLVISALRITSGEVQTAWRALDVLRDELVHEIDATRSERRTA